MDEAVPSLFFRVRALAFAVLLRLVSGGLAGVLVSGPAMSVSDVGVMIPLLRLARLVMAGSLAVMSGSVLVMLGGVAMVLCWMSC